MSRIPSFDETEQRVIYDHQKPTELNLLKFMYDPQRRMSDMQETPRGNTPYDSVGTGFRFYGTVNIRDPHYPYCYPQSAILHVVEISMEGGMLGIECEASPLFDKESCLRAWLKSYRGRPGIVLKPQEFLVRMARRRNVEPN